MSTREIARAVGIKAPSIYNHFLSKEEILFAALDAVIDEFLTETLGRVDPSQSPLDQLIGIVHRHVLYDLAPRSPGRVGVTLFLLDAERLVGYLSGKRRQSVRAKQRRYFEAIRDLVHRASASEQTDIDSTVRAFAIIAICGRVGSWYRTEGRLTPERVAHDAIRLVLLMLGLGPTPVGPAH